MHLNRGHGTRSVPYSSLPAKLKKMHSAELAAVSVNSGKIWWFDIIFINT